MNHSLAAIDPFYAACLSMAASPAEAEPAKPIYARLPLAPSNASPVPHLTSLYHFHRAGEYGDRSYPGNCGGNLIRDLLALLQAHGIVCDPMAGSGHVPRRLRRTRHPLHVVGHPSGIRRLRSAGVFSQRDVRLHLGSSALLAAEVVRRRCTRLVTVADARGFPASLRPVHPQLCPSSETRRQALHPNGRLQRPRRRLCPSRVSHQTACPACRIEAALHRHHPLQPRGQQLEEGLPLVLHPRPARRVHDFREANQPRKETLMKPYRITIQVPAHGGRGVGQPRRHL